MGRILTLRPSPWEIDNIEGVVAGVLYAERHDGDAPDGPMWRWLDRRRDVNPERFDAHHPNIGLVLGGYYRHEVQPQCVEVRTLCDPPPPHGAQQVVPEPASWLLLAVAMAWVYWRARHG